MKHKPFQFTVSPDFAPTSLAGWHIFNTWLQRSLDTRIHLDIYQDFASQRQAIRNDAIDLIFANPYDASMLIREKGFHCLARPGGRSDEVVIAVRGDHPASTVEGLEAGMRLASTDDPDVHMMGMIMLEPANINADNIERRICSSYVLVAKELLSVQSEVGLFLAEAFYELSKITRRQLRPLVQSQIQVVHHALMVGPRMQHLNEVLLQRLQEMPQTARGQGVLDSLGYKTWEAVEEEDVEFMIDLMDTLVG